MPVVNVLEKCLESIKKFWFVLKTGQVTLRMSCNIRTRSSKRRPTRNIKSSRCIGDCCENNNSVNAKKPQTPKLQAPNALNKKKTPLSKQKTTKQTRRGKNGAVSANKKSFTSPILSDNIIDRNTNNCVVLLTRLPQRIVREKTEVHQVPKKTVITSVDSIVDMRSSARNAEKKDKRVVNKIVESENENKTPVTTNNNNASKKNKRPVLRPRRNVNDSKETPSIENNVKKDLVEKKLVYSTVKKDIKSFSNISMNNENTTNKHDILFKKPVLSSNSSKLDNDTSLAPVSKLRKRKTFNYAESSLDSSTESQTITENNSNKIPIYKQPIVENKNRKKRPGDLYEFDESDNENVKKKKRRKVSNSSSEEYDITIKNILKNVVNKIKKNKKEIYSDARNNNIKVKQIKSVPSTKTKKIENCEIGHSKENKNPVMQTATDKLEEINMKGEAAQSSETSQMPQEINQVNNLQVTIEDLDNSHDLSDAYDFEKGSSKTSSSKIKIISDIQLQPDKELNLTVATPTTFRESRPNANSTMLNVFTPWRFNEINIKRNPHFLAIKESSLPCITQEMVLDHTIVDKFEDITKTHSGKTPQRKTEEKHTVKKTPVQKYVTDYFGGGKENNKENMNVSLFDYDQFSPIKGRNQTIGNADHAKRKILGEINDNVANQILSSTPRHAPTSSDDHLTNFGFSSDEDEESNGLVAVKKNKEDKPFRVSVNVNDKKYTRPKKVRLRKPVEPSSYEESDWEELSDAESHSGEIKLFEDFNATEDLLKLQEPKFTKKRTKLKEFNDDNHKQRRKKDVRTKEEEEEAEKWASAFNSMCEEIDKFPLEIE